MRRLFIAGNWKMNTNSAEAVSLAKAVAGKLGKEADIDIAVCPPFVYLAQVQAAIKGTKIALALRTATSRTTGRLPAKFPARC